MPLTYGYCLREQPSALEVNLSLDTVKWSVELAYQRPGYLRWFWAPCFSMSHRKLRGDLRVGRLQGFKEGYAAEPRVGLRSNSLFLLNDVRFSHFNSR